MTTPPPPPPGDDPGTGVVPPVGPSRPVVLPGDPGTEVYDELARSAPAEPEEAVWPNGAPSVPEWLRIGVAVLAVLLVLVLAGLIVDKVRPSVFASLRNQSGTTDHRGAGSSSSPSSGRGSSSSSSLTSSSLPSGAAPVISSLQPAAAAGGSQITIDGSGFLSANGDIVATFNGSKTHTICPSSQRCVATVPSGPKAGATAAVRVQTESGRSNAVTFTYR